MTLNLYLDSYLKLILEKGGDPNTTTHSESATPLILAAKSGFGGILKEFFFMI